MVITDEAQAEKLRKRGHTVVGPKDVYDETRAGGGTEATARNEVRKMGPRFWLVWHRRAIMDA